MSETPVKISVIICYLILALPLGITSIVLSQSDSDHCDYRDQMGLDVKHYLLGSGIASLVVALLIATIVLSSVCCGDGVLGFLPVITVLNILFGITWFIVGGVILFRSNLECIREGSVPVVYALVLWCISATTVFSTR